MDQRSAQNRPTEPTSYSRRAMITVLAMVFTSAVVMGVPALRGGFLSGDDIQLARDHVYVNHPSFAHGVRLFGMFHRDLYQPVALLSLSLDFAVVRALGLAPESDGSPPGAWVFHLTNVLLHAVNAMLICLLVLRAARHLPAAAIAGCLFALHPLGVEVVAWISGRMMLLSTMFLLATVVTMDAWRARGGWWRAALVLLFAALCMMSKVRIALPVLLLVSAAYSRRVPTRRWWFAWGAVSALTLVFVFINYQASSGMLARGEEYLQGSRIARTVLALGWYFSHVLVPVGLSPFHPAAQAVDWSYPGLPRAGAVVLVVVGLLIWSARRTRVGWCGLLWFGASVAITLPLLPSRNLALAERYAYLSNIGLYAIIAAVLVGAYRYTHRRFGGVRVSVIGVLTAAVVAVVLCAASWRTMRYYRDDLGRSARIATLYPDHPGVGVRHAWSLYHAGHYSQAIATAQRDLERHGDAVRSDALQVIGMAHFRAGDRESALARLRQALAADESSGLAYSRLAGVLEETGDLDAALTAYERCAELLPNYNPGLTNLAQLYRRTGQADDARRVYEQVLANNPFDVTATTSLAELDVEQGRHDTALQRLQALLRWMPEHVPARINAALCLSALGDDSAARREYERALQDDPEATVAVINLANLLVEMGLREQAHSVLAEHLAGHPTQRDVLDTACAHLLSEGDSSGAARLLVRAIAAEPAGADLLGRYVWVSCLGDQWEIAAQQATRALSLDANEPLAGIARCAIELHYGRSTEAIVMVQELVDAGVLHDNVFFTALEAVLDRYAQTHDDDPWPYYVRCLACAATGRLDAARHAAAEFKQRLNDTAWHERIDALLTTAAPSP